MCFRICTKRRCTWRRISPALERERSCWKRWPRAFRSSPRLLELKELPLSLGALIADTITDTIDSLLRLLASVEDRRRFGLAARQVAEARYDWNRCLFPVEQLYRDLERSEARIC